MDKIIEIKSKGIHHIQIIHDELDMEILKAVLKKVEKYAEKIINQNNAVIDFVI